MSRFRPRAEGLTLVEMIVTVAILGIFLTLLSFHLVALSNLWLNRDDGDRFDQHADGVALFLAEALASSEAAAGAAAGRPVEWSRLPGAGEFDEPLLHFRQAEAPALFVREGLPLPAIRAWLHFERGQGLSILWHSALDADEPESARSLNRTVISPFVSKIEYAYYDMEDDRWEMLERPREQARREFVLPDFLRLTFTHPEHGERRRSILVPQGSAELPLF